MFSVGAGIVMSTTAVVFSGSIVSGGLVQQRILDAPNRPGTNNNASTGTRLPDSLRSNVSDCILLFGAFCNGNLGDVIQASTMSRLVKSVTSENLCVWHAYPSKENTANGFQEGEFFANDSAGLIPLSCDRESGEQVSRFKGLIIGGGGLLVSIHSPLDCEAFVEGLGNELPVVLFAIGAGSKAEKGWPIIQRANYVSGRDQRSTTILSSLLGRLEAPRAKPHEVARVRDPVLSDRYFMDVEGACWKQNEGQNNTTKNGPLCFILPSAQETYLKMLHRVFSSDIVGQDDVLLNVFPKHQAEIEAYSYPVPVQAILEPEGFLPRLCECRAVVSSRLHGVILSLHAGIPTLAAWPIQQGKVYDLMKEVLHLPDQFVEVKDGMTRETLDRRVDRVRSAYAHGRRNTLFEKLEYISRRTKNRVSHVLKQLIHVSLAEDGIGNGTDAPTFWNMPASLPFVGEESADGVTETLLYGKSSTEDSEHEPARQTDLAAPSSLRKWWGATVYTEERPQSSYKIEARMPLSGSPVLSLGALGLIVLLGLPGVASLSKRKISSHAHQTEGISKEETTGRSEAGFAANTTVQLVSLFRKHKPRVSAFVFFGLNYVIWVVLSMGFSICSKAYMNESRNPMALLAIQGWVGIAILCAMNAAGRCRHRSANSSFCSNTNDTISSSTPSWLGICGLEQARRERRNVWQAGLLHSVNAVLTSWSVLVGGVAATHALKALEPVVAAIFSRWLLGSTLPPRRAASVAIIVLGLGIFMMPSYLLKWASEKLNPASVEGFSSSDSWYSGVNLAVPALVTTCACCAVVLRNILLKRVDPPPPPPPLGLLVCCVVGAGTGSFALLVLVLPFGWEEAKTTLLRMGGVNAALCFVGYNLASFNLLSELSPVGHAVGNATKRVCLLATGLFLLGEERSISPYQLVGASLAFVGLASYNLAGTCSLTAPSLSR